MLEKKLALLNFSVIRKHIKRTWWRINNLSPNQFISEFLFRRFKEVTLKDLPTYGFADVPRENFENSYDSEKLSYFLMIKPNGLAKEVEIKKILDNAGLVVIREISINRFFDIAYHIFQINKIHDYRHGLPEGQIWLKLLEIHYPDQCQQLKIIYFRNSDEKTLNKVKQKIRRQVGVEFYRVNIGKARLITCMTPVHTSDKKSLKKETLIIEYFAKQANNSHENKAS